MNALRQARMINNVAYECSEKAVLATAGAVVASSVVIPALFLAL